MASRDQNPAGSYPHGSQSKVPPGVVYMQQHVPSRVRDSAYTAPFTRSQVEEGSPRRHTVSAEAFLAADVSAASERATDLLSRSTLMLVAGVVIAFIGVAVFYVSLPQFQPGEDRWTYLEKGIRPTGMLVFVEGIAWFLLRQYRALIEDYKAFLRMYLKRANYLVALKTLSLTEVCPAQLFLAASMISEDLTGRLRSGETTENIESVKNTEPNPVSSLLQSLLEGLRKK